MSFFGREEVVVRFDRHTLQAITDALTGRDYQLAILQRIEQKVNQMAANLDKLNAGFTKLNTSNDALVTSFAEIVAEFKALAEAVNDPAHQAELDAFGDKLSNAADAISAQAQAFRDINPDLPPPPPPDPENPGVAARRRR